MPRLGAIKTSTARVIDLKTSFVALSPVANPEALYPPHFKAVLARILCEPILILLSPCRRFIISPSFSA
jgi:hypothetical protein